IRDFHVTGVQTCALPISRGGTSRCQYRQLRPALEDGGLDAGGVQAAVGEQLLTAGVLQELVRQPQRKDGHEYTLTLQQFEHGAADRKSVVQGTDVDLRGL